MSKFVEQISYVGRLIVGKLREWARMVAAWRELSALENRRDELLLRLGRRYQVYLAESGAEPPPAVAETAEDLRVLLQQIRRLNDEKQRAREETLAYLRPEPTPQPPPRAVPQAAGGGIKVPEGLPARRRAPSGAAARTCECGAELPAGAMFCPTCGKAQPGAVRAPADIAPPRKCPHCNAEVPYQAEFCPECGGHMDAQVYEM